MNLVLELEHGRIKLRLELMGFAPTKGLRGELSVSFPFGNKKRCEFCDLTTELGYDPTEPRWKLWGFGCDGSPDLVEFEEGAMKTLKFGFESVFAGDCDTAELKY